MSDWSRRGMLMYGMPPAPERTPDEDGPLPLPDWFTNPGHEPPDPEEVRKAIEAMKRQAKAPSSPGATPADHRAKWIAEAEAAHRELADVCADDRVSEVPWPLVRRVELALHRLLLLNRESGVSGGGK